MSRNFWAAIIIAVTVAVHLWFGSFGGVRFFGSFFVLASLYFLFVAELPMHIGQQNVGSLTGWKKTIVLLPVLGVGLLMIYFGPEVTCASATYKHLCV